MNELTTDVKNTSLVIDKNENIFSVLKDSVYPNASEASIKLVLDYCKAAQLDPLQKPVHIVPMWDPKLGGMRDTIMPGINLYRTQAARSGEFAGISEPLYGPSQTENIGGVTLTYPLFCIITVKRRLKSGEIATFASQEFWKENYATRGGKDKSIAPNAMWLKRPYGQLAKCAEAQALRKAFPEIAGAYAAEEMEGKSFFDTQEPIHTKPLEQTKSFEEMDWDLLKKATEAANKGFDEYYKFWSSISNEDKRKIGTKKHAEFKSIAKQIGEQTQEPNDSLDEILKQFEGAKVE